VSGRFVQRLNAISPNGAIRLAGYAFGACIAVEMALQLQQQLAGCHVQSLVLLHGSHLFVGECVDRTVQQLASSGNTADTQTAAICTFVSQLALRLISAQEVSHFVNSAVNVNCIGELKSLVQIRRLALKSAYVSFYGYRNQRNGSKNEVFQR